MKIQAKTNCPLNNFEPCRSLDCAWFIQIQGTNANTGEELNDWGCSMTFLPILLIDNTNHQRQTGAAVESFRNEMVKSNQVSQQVLLQTVAAQNPNMKFIEAEK